MNKKSVVTTLFTVLGILLFGLPGQAQQTQNSLVVASCGAPTYAVGRLIYSTVDVHGNACTGITATISLGTSTINTNTAQVNGATVNVGLGTASTGTARVAISNDSYISSATSDTVSNPGRVMVVAGAGPGGYLPLNQAINGDLVVDFGGGTLTTTVSSMPGGVNVGASAPGSTVMDGLNVGGTARSHTGVNSSGSVYSAQNDTTSVNGVTVLTGAGATGTGSQRNTVAQDTTTIAGSAPGTAGTASANVITVQGIASMTALGVTDTTIPAQASTTSGQKGPLVQCAVTTSSPTYTTAQTDPVSCDTSGSIRVAVVSGSTGNAAASNTGSAVPTQGDYSGINVGGTLRGQTGVNPTGTVYATQMDLSSVAGTVADTNSGNKSAGTLRVVLATDQPQLTNKLLVTPDANSAINNAQWGGFSAVSGGTNGSVGVGGLAANGSAIVGQPVMIAGASGTTVAYLQVSPTTNALKVDASSTPATGTQTAANSSSIVCSTDNFCQSIGTLADNGVAAGTNRVGTLPGIARSNYPTAATAGRNTAQSTDLYGVTWTGQLPTGLTTYVAIASGTVAATATDIAVLPGNATNTVIVTQVEASCTQTTAAINDVYLILRSSADTSGTSQAMTSVKMDSGNASAVSLPLQYSANPTLGTLVGSIDRQKIGFNAPAGTNSDFYLWKPTMGQSITLRGTAQELAVNLGGQTTTGAACDVQFTWIETTGL